MNISQRQTVIDCIDKIKLLNLEEIFASKIGQEADSSATSAGNYSVLEEFVLLRKMITQLEEKINDENYWFLLPMTHNFNNDFGTCILQTNLTNLHSYISRGDFTNAATQLNILIYYQIANNFWRNVNDFNQEELLEKIRTSDDRLNILLAHLEERRVMLNNLIQETDGLKDEINSFKEEKITEYTTLTNNQHESEEIISDIQEKQANINAIADEVYTVKNECIQTNQEIKSLHEQSEERQNSINIVFSDFQTQSEQALNEMNGMLAQIDTDHQEVAGKKDEVTRMMGYISDGTLSHSFNSRKKEVQKTTNTWLWVSIVSAILMGGWIYVVFTWLSTSTGNIIADMVINAIKTTPLIALFWFSLKQYSKERNLLEEYAFREAIAITLTAYAEQIELISPENTHKIELLKETVNRLYLKPQITNEGIGLFSFKSKDLVDLMHEVKEIVSEIKLNR